MKSNATINIKVVVGSSRVKIEEQGDNSLKVWLTAKPHDNQANLQLLTVLADFYQIPKTTIKIIKGLKSKNKTVKID